MCEEDRELFIGQTGKLLRLCSEISYVREKAMTCVLEINSNSGLRRGHVESYHSTSKTSYLHNNNAYYYQTWKGGDLP